MILIAELKLKRRFKLAREASTDIKVAIRTRWHKTSGTYDRLSFPAPEEEKAAYKRALEKVLKKDRLNILDVGAGTGFLSLLLAEMGHSVTALDLTESMLEKAKTKARESGLCIRFEPGDAEGLPFGDESFDAVVCRHLLWTLPNPLKALNEWVRVTRPGGQIMAIEGKWRASSLIGHLQRLSRQLTIVVHARANPGRYDYGRDVKRMLPFSDGITPEQAIDLFQQLGLGNVSVQVLDEIRDIRRRSLPLLPKIAYSSPTFLIRGECPEG